MKTDNLEINDLPNKNYCMTFRNVGGIWRKVNSHEPNAPTLAEVLNILEIVIDDAAQFCRIIRYHDNEIETITYRAYNMAKVTITINYNKYE